MSTAAVQQQLLQLLADLPADQNPYSAISSFLRLQLFPSVPYSATIQLYVICGLIALTAILVVISLLVRWRKGIFWFVRVQQSPRMIRPHATISWALVAVVMLGLFEAIAVAEIRFFRAEIRSGFGFWLLLVWGVAWLGGHTAAWSLSVSYITHLQATNSRLPTHLFATASNIIGAGMIPIYVSVLLPLGILGGLRYKHAMQAFEEINTMLEQAGSTWAEGQSVNVIALAPALPLVQNLQENVDSFVYFFRAVFIWYAITAAGLVVILVLIAFLHLSSLRRTLATTTRDLSSSNNLDSLNPNGSAIRRNPQQKRVYRTLQSLTATIVAMSLLGTFFTGISILAALSPLSLVSSPTRCQIITLGPLWAFTFFGLPCAVLLVVRALDARPSEEKEASGRSSGGSSGRAKKLGFGAGQGGGGRGTNEFSIQLAPMSPLDFSSAELSRSGVEEGQEEEKKRPGLWRGVSSRGSGGKKGRRESRDVTLSHSVSVHVDVDVVVDDGEEEELKRKEEEKADYPSYLRVKTLPSRT